MAKKRIEPKADHVRCEYTKLVKLADLKPNPDNPNKHDPKQIAELARVLKYQGIRKPLVVSNQSGMVVTGHGTLEAIRLNGWPSAPVDFQDFADAEAEYAHMVADNALQQWSKLDLGAINLKLPELDSSKIDLDMFGLKGGFKVDPSELPGEEDGESEEFRRDSGDVMRMMLLFEANQYKSVMEKVLELTEHYKMTNLTDLFVKLVDDAHKRECK